LGALDEAQQRAIWQLPVSAARQTRVTGKPRCAKYELHTLRDFESNGVIEACVRPLKIRRLGGFRAGSVKTPDLRRLSQMCAHDAAGVRAEEGLSASRRAFDERMEARQRELSCHHVTQRFEHIMLPAEEDLGAPPTPPAAEVLVPDSDEEDDTVDSTPRSHRCELCGLHQPCTGAGCTLCVQASVFTRMRKVAHDAPARSTTPPPPPTKKRKVDGQIVF
jgi:hypothetical protein